MDVLSILTRRFRRRHAWLLPLSLGVIGAIISTTGAPTELEAAIEASAVPPPAPAPAPRSKDGAALLDRNMFCSACAPAEPLPPGDPEASGDIVLTNLPLELLATSLAARSIDSFATLRNRTTDQQGAYGIGDSVPGAGPLVRINGDYADFENPATGRVERVALIAAAAPPPTSRQPAATKASAADPFADQIRAAGADRYEIDAALVKQLTTNPAAIRGVRFAPHLDSGKITGFQLAFAAKGSIATALGLRRGDVVQAVNGLALSSPDALLEVYTRLREQTTFSADVLRGGKRVTLSYAIR